MYDHMSEDGKVKQIYCIPIEILLHVLLSGYKTVILVNLLIYLRHFNDECGTRLEDLPAPAAIVGIWYQTYTNSSGGSRISKRWGRQPFGEEGVPTYGFAKFPQKTAWNWKNLDPSGRASKILLCISATELSADHKHAARLFTKAGPIQLVDLCSVMLIKEAVHYCSHPS